MAEGIEVQGGVVGHGRQREERAKVWNKLNEEWRTSGLSQAEFCRQKGVSLSVFRWWRYHRIQSPKPQASGAAFFPVRIVRRRREETDSPSRKVLEIVLRGGRVVRIGEDFDPVLLRKLLAVLDAGVSC